MSNFGKGIPLASGFDLGAKAPLDSRITVQNIQERNAHVTNNRAYKGLRVYVVDENCEYLWNGNEWLLIPSKQYVDDAIANVKISDEQLANYATKDEIPTKTSQLENDSSFATESFVTNKIAEAQLQQGEVDLNGYQTKEDTTLETTNKTIVGAINEVNTNVMSKANKSEIPTKTSQLTNDSNFLTSIPSEYVTESKLNAKGYLTSVPSEYVTESELNDKGYLTEHQDISNKANKSDIPTKTSQLTNDNGFITTIPSEYITESELSTELSTKADITDIPSLEGYATETYVTNKIAEASLSGGEVDLSGYATKDELSTKANVSHTHTMSNITDLIIPDVDKAYVDTQLNTKANKSDIPNLDGYALKTDIPTVPTKTSQLTNDSNFISSIPSEYITEEELETKGYLTEHQDISGKADKLYVDTELATKSDTTHTHSYNDLSDKPVIPSINGLATKKELTDGLATKSDKTHTHDQYLTEHQDLSDYALKTELPSVPTKTSQLTNDSGYITSIPSEYITESELNAKGYLTEHQDISNKADKSEMPTKTSQLTNDSNFLTSVPSEYVTETELNAKGYLTEHQSLENYALKTELPTKTSQLTNDSGYLTQHQDISGKADKSEIPTKTSQLTNDSNFAVQPNFTFEINMIASTEQPNVVTNGTYPNLVVTFNIPQGTSLDESGKPIYYGRLSISEVGGSVVQYNSITDAMIKSGTNITKITPQTLDRVSVGRQSETSKGDYIIVAVPNNEGYIVKKDNGLGGKIIFDKDVAGANGVILNIDGNEYEIYGEILISPAEIFIYIDKN